MNLMRITTLFTLFATMALGCGGSTKLSSQWADRQIKVDGAQTEWDGGVSFIENKNVALGFFNDDEYLYVSMTTTDRKVQSQFMAMGFRLWLDPNGGKDRSFGVKFPVGMTDLGIMLRGRGQSQDLEAMKEHFQKSLVNLELTLPGEEEPRLLRVEEAQGIEVKVGDMQDGLVYEIKVPLHKSDDHPFAIQAKPGKPIGVGFETAQFDRKKMREQMQNSGSRGRPSGFGGGRGGSGGRRGGGQGGRMGQRPEGPEPFKIWASVALSSADSEASATQMPELAADSNP